MKQSMVAMSGHIMPAPLATAETVAVFSPTASCLDAYLGKASVVMIASAASTALSPPRPLTSFGMAFLIFPAGRRSPITPVEEGTTRDSSYCSGGERAA